MALEPIHPQRFPDPVHWLVRFPRRIDLSHPNHAVRADDVETGVGTLNRGAAQHILRMRDQFLRLIGQDRSSSAPAADNAFPGWRAFNEMIGIGGWRGRNEQAGPMWHFKDAALVSDQKPGAAGSHGSG